MKRLIAILAAILFLVSSGLYGCGINKDVSVGTVWLVTGGTQYEPMENLTQAYTHDVYSDGRVKKPQDVEGELSTISISDGTKITIKGRTKNAPTYTLYNDQYQEVYSSQTEFSIPDEPGKYILCVGVTWGEKDKEEYSVYQYFFMIEM